MNILLVSSKKDLASNNFKERLFENYNLKKINEDLYQLDIESENKIYFKEIESLHIYSTEEDIKEKISFNIIIFLSKHSTLTDSKPPCMTVHSVGNWKNADLGGKNETIVKSDGVLIREILINLKEKKPKEIKSYEVKQEATHHGPFLKETTLFYEIGSKKEDWENEKVAKFMISILIDVIKNYNKEKIVSEKKWIEVLGIGGSHYCTKFNKFTFDKNKKYCFIHVIPDYILKDINEEELERIIKKNNFKEVIYEKDLKKIN